MSRHLEDEAFIQKYRDIPNLRMSVGAKQRIMDALMDEVEHATVKSRGKVRRVGPFRWLPATVAAIILVGGAVALSPSGQSMVKNGRAYLTGGKASDAATTQPYPYESLLGFTPIELDVLPTGYHVDFISCELQFGDVYKESHIFNIHYASTGNAWFTILEQPTKEEPPQDFTFGDWKPTYIDGQQVLVRHSTGADWEVRFEKDGLTYDVTASIDTNETAVDNVVKNLTKPVTAPPLHIRRDAFGIPAAEAALPGKVIIPKTLPSGYQANDVVTGTDSSLSDGKIKDSVAAMFATYRSQLLRWSQVTFTAKPGHVNLQGETTTQKLSGVDVYVSKQPMLSWNDPHQNVSYSLYGIPDKQQLADLAKYIIGLQAKNP